MSKLYYAIIVKPVWRVYDSQWKLIAEVHTEYKAKYIYEKNSYYWVNFPIGYHIVEDTVAEKVLDTPPSDYD